jgi:hypothetical protein
LPKSRQSRRLRPWSYATGWTPSRSLTEGCHSQCSLDAGGFRGCESPKTYADLGGGQHKFAVRAEDGDGNIGASAEHRWTIAEVGENPETRILKHPPPRTTETSAAFVFVSDPDVTFVCTLDGRSENCTSPRVYSKLTQGMHTFAVRARNREGTSGPSVSYQWSIVAPAYRDPPVTTIGTAPAKRSFNTFATFTFSANESNVRFSCSLDGGAFEPCASPRTYNNLRDNADHTFAVRATDAAGNTGKAEVYSWEIAPG